jgi:hypothetical protein
LNGGGNKRRYGTSEARLCEELMVVMNTGLFEYLFGVLLVVSRDLDE